MPKFVRENIVPHRAETSDVRKAVSSNEFEPHSNGPRVPPQISSLFLAGLAIACAAVDKGTAAYSAVKLGQIAGNGIKKLGLPDLPRAILEIGVGDTIAKLAVKPVVQSALKFSIEPSPVTTAFPATPKRQSETRQEFEARELQQSSKRQLMLKKQSAFNPSGLPFDAIHLLGFGVAASICERHIPMSYPGKSAVISGAGAIISAVLHSFSQLVTSVDGKAVFEIKPAPIQRPLRSVKATWDKQIIKDYQLKNVATDNPLTNLHHGAENTAYVAKQLVRLFAFTSAQWSTPILLAPLANKVIKAPGRRMAARLGLGGFFPNIATMPKTVSQKEQAFAVTEEVIREATSLLDSKRDGPKSLHSLLTADNGSIHPMVARIATGAENLNQVIGLPAKVALPFVLELSEAVLTGALRVVSTVAKDSYDVFKSGEVVSFP